MLSSWWQVSIVVSAVWTCVRAGSNGLISDALIKPPLWSTLTPATQVGAVFTDPAFSTSIIRVTNCGLSNSQALGGYMGNSEICTFNCDGSYFIATENIDQDGKEINATFLYSGSTGSRLKMLGKDTIRPWWIRWALVGRYKANGQYVTFDPIYHFYKYEGNEIRLYDVRDMSQYVVIRRFNEYGAIGPAGGEGDISDDGRYWCLDGDQRELFVYDLIDDLKYTASAFDVGVIGSPGSQVGVDYATVSAAGQYVLVSWSTPPAEARFHGIEVYDRHFKFLRQVYPGIIHWETGVDRFGNDVIYTTAGFALAEFFTSRGVQPGDLISIRLSDGYIRLLKHLPNWASQVMSGCNSVHNRNFVYASMYGRSSDPDKVWAPFWGEILEIPTDGSGEVRRLVHHRSRELAGKSEKYWQPDLVVNRQGTKIVYRSTFLGPTADLYLFNIDSREGSDDLIPPLSPTGLKNIEQTLQSIRLSWQRPAPAPDGDIGAYFRIFRDEKLLAEQVETEYNDLGLAEDSSYNYRVFNVDKAGNVSTPAAVGTFRTLPDLIPPKTLYATIVDRNHISIQFSEPVEKISAESLSNYLFTPIIPVSAVNLATDGLAVVLTCNSLELGKIYRFSVLNIKDRSKRGNLLTPPGVFELELLADFYEDFENGLAEYWQRLHRPSWALVVDQGDHSLYLAASGYDSPDGKRLGEYVLLDKKIFSAREFSLRCNIRSDENILQNPYADYAIVIAYQDSVNYYYIQFHSYDAVLTKIKNSNKEIVAKTALQINFTEYLPIRVKVQNDSCSVWMNQQRILYQALESWPAGSVGFGSFNDRCYFDDINLNAFYKNDTIPPLPPRGVIALPLH